MEVSVSVALSHLVSNRLSPVFEEDNSHISGRLPGVEMVVGQANKSDQKDDGAGHEDRRPVRSHLTKHDGQAIPFLYFPTRVLSQRGGNVHTNEGNERCRQGH